LNLLGSLLGFFLMFFLSFCGRLRVVCSHKFSVYPFFVVQRQNSLLFAVSVAFLAVVILAWPVNPLWNRVYSPYQMLELGYGEDGC